MQRKLISKKYLIHSTFAHGALHELNKELKLNLDKGIAKALYERSEIEEKWRHQENRTKNRGVKRPRSVSTGKEGQRDSQNSSNANLEEERKMAQKLNSYTKLTEKEVQVLRKDIPLRRSTLVEKDELRNALKKVLTKLHLVYTIGVNKVPQEYVNIRNSITTNVNRLYDENNSDRRENLRQE